MSGRLTMLLTGDIILDEPEPDTYFDAVRPLLWSADIVVGHVEVPFPGPERNPEYLARHPGRTQDKLDALPRANVRVATLAANHLLDAGPVGVLDTVEALRARGLETAGAGADLGEASRPALFEKEGVRVGVLSYNCVGPRAGWAGPDRPGCAHVQVLTHYELDHDNPGGPPTIFTFTHPHHVDRMAADIARLRQNVNVVVVALHKGVVHTPALLAMYERPIARAAIDAGADLVISHHAHIARGFEVYRDRPIFHGLGNFVTVTQALNVTKNSDQAAHDWARRRLQLFNFHPDPNYPTYAFHPESTNALVAICELDGGGVVSAGFVPLWINPRGQPEPASRTGREGDVISYLEGITEAAELETTFRRTPDRVLFFERAGDGRCR